jgi:hypothetical protein
LVDSQGWEREIRLNYSYLPKLNKSIKLFKDSIPHILPSSFSLQEIITAYSSPSGWGVTLNLLG